MSAYYLLLWLLISSGIGPVDFAPSAGFLTPARPRPPLRLVHQEQSEYEADDIQHHQNEDREVEKYHLFRTRVIDKTDPLSLGCPANARVEVRLLTQTRL